MQNELLFSIMLFAPLASFIIAASFSTSLPNKTIGYISSLFILASFAIASYFFMFNLEGLSVNYFSFIEVASFSVDFSFRLDRVSMIMAIVVTLVSSAVFFYSIGYMEHDRGFNRFFAYLSAFVFSMLILILGDNLLMIFIGWEGVGTCSYLLIGFWYKKASANFASMEAFIMNRVADLGFLIGIFLVYEVFGTLNIEDIKSILSSNIQLVIGENIYLLIWICALLFIGAMGKSAQFPFHTWLANAMEGPTPVSALIHAATMVTAGVYLIIKLSFLYYVVPEISLFITYLGAFVVIFAAAMAIVNRDLKRIIAYSTLSQLGYMFAAVGLGYTDIALFHLFTHAFFKSLLFLGAGNVMHSMEDRLDITKMGGLYTSMRPTAILMTLGTLSLCGIYPFAGFFSKDLILEVAFLEHRFFIFAILLLGAALTAFYSFRLLVLVFFAPKNHNIEHVHKTSSIMITPLLPLGVLAIFAWILKPVIIPFIPHGNSLLFGEDPNTFLNIIFSKHSHISLIIISTIVVLASSFIAIRKYKNGYKEGKKGVLYMILINQYYIPKFYDYFIIRTYSMLSSFLYNVVEMGIIDRFVDFLAKIPVFISKLLQPIQNGNLSSVLRFMFLGLLVIIISALAYIGSL